MLAPKSISEMKHYEQFANYNPYDKKSGETPATIPSGFGAQTQEPSSSGPSGFGALETEAAGKTPSADDVPF